MSKFLLIPTAVMAMAAALIFYSVAEIRTAARRDSDDGWGWVQIDPELQRVALAYFKEEVRRQEETRKPAMVTIELPTPDPKAAEEAQRLKQQFEEQRKATTERQKQQIEDNRKKVLESNPWLEKIWTK